jgi:hypothetical protein
MPGYDNSNWFALFFTVYMLISNYIFMSILLAVIYNNYRKHLKACNSFDRVSQNKCKVLLKNAVSTTRCESRGLAHGTYPLLFAKIIEIEPIVT